MYPVSGGTARFPHLAYGPGAGISFGFFSWLQAVTVPPIEAFAVIHYAGYYWTAIYDPNANGGNGNVTHWGFVLEIVLMAVFTAVNFLPMRIYGPLYSAVTWWKVAIPVLTIIVLFTQVPQREPDRGRRLLPHRHRLKDLFGALPGAGIVFAYLGFEQADQLAGEIKNPQRNLPIAIIGSIIIGAVIYILLQVVFIGATPASLLDPRVRRHSREQRDRARPVRRAGVARGLRLAVRHPAGGRVHLARRHRRHLQHLDLAGLLRPGQEPVLPGHLRHGRQARRPVVRHDHGVHRRPGLHASRSRAGTRWSAWSPRRAC